MMTADRIKKAVAAVKADRPAYKELLGFYEKLFLAQEAAREKLQLDPIEIPAELLSVKQRETFPLINRSEFSIDMDTSEALLRDICQVAMTSNDPLAENSQKMVRALDNGLVDAPTLFSNILIEDQVYFDETSASLSVDNKILAFFAYSSVRPSLLACSEQVAAAHLDNEKTWEGGYCPVCGALPALSVLRNEGERFLLCGFCAHEWKMQRLYCPFCDNRDPKTLHYFFSEEEKGYRVDVCEQCKKYVKTVDIREINHPFCPQVEQVSTLHLDILAQEQGLESGSSIWLPT